MATISAATVAAAAATGASYAYVDLSLHRMGASATAIGLNAAMPALAWLLTTPLMPVLLRRCDPAAVLRVLLGVAILSPFGFLVSTDQGVWMVLRFLFGGSLGMVFRLIEYWINAASPDDRRGRNVGLYAGVFCAGAAAGAALVPLTGTQGWPTILLIQALVGTALAVLSVTRAAPPPIFGPARVPPAVLGTSVAVMAALAFGLFEAVPYTLMPVYAVKSGLSEAWAAGTVSAFLVGALIVPVPAGMLADRFGKPGVLAACAAVGLAVPLVLPAALDTPAVLLAVMVLWGGGAGSLYTVALAMLADRFRGADLAAANVAFGTLYAAGALIGPPLHGLAMDRHDPHGLMESSILLFAALLAVVIGKHRRRRSPA
nr:MFS transporter [Azospirillum halopraeferens]